MSIANQNIGKLHHYDDPQFNVEFDRIYDFLSRAKFPDNSVNGRKLQNGSTPETKLILPLSVAVVAQPGYFVGDTVTITTTLYTVLDRDRTILADDDAAGGAITITLPTAAANKHRELAIKKIGSTGTVTLTGDTIDEAATKDIIAQYDAVQIVSDGVEWWIIGEFS